MNEQTVTETADRFPWASWAIWDENFPDGECVERTPARLVDFVKEHVTDLSPDVVLMGLNRSDELESPFENFHAPTRNHYDYRLKDFIQDGDLDRLHGAYMTDLVDQVDPDSNRVEVTETDAEVLVEQLRLLGELEYHVICFGNKPFEGLTRYIDVEATRQSPEVKYATAEIEGLTLHLYRVWFYGLYGVYQSRVETLERQLQRLNERIEAADT